MPAGALTSFNVCDAYRYFASHAVIDGRKQVTQRIFNTDG